MIGWLYLVGGASTGMGVFWPNTVNSLRPAFFTSCAAVRSIRNNLAVPAVKMGNAFRRQPEPALYGENKTPVSEDLLEVGLLVAFGLIGFSFILIIPGIRGWERLWATVRVFVALWIGAVLLGKSVGKDTLRVAIKFVFLSCSVQLWLRLVHQHDNYGDAVQAIHRDGDTCGGRPPYRPARS